MLLQATELASGAWVVLKGPYQAPRGSPKTHHYHSSYDEQPHISSP